MKHSRWMRSKASMFEQGLGDRGCKEGVSGVHFSIGGGAGLNVYSKSFGFVVLSLERPVKAACSHSRKIT